MDTKVLYITQSGTLSRKDNTLYFENTSLKKVIPIIGIEQIYCLGEVTINSKLLSYLTENKITIHFFNYYGYYTGSYHPRESFISGKLFVEQVNHYQELEKRLILAKNIVKGIGYNMLYVLEHYQKQGISEIGTYMKDIRNQIKEIEKQEINSVNKAMWIEGNLWAVFYSSFKEFLPDDFLMNKRVKRPPDNPMNALISFGNSVLYSYTLTKIYHTQLNPTISYLHEPFERRFSLSLDLCEVFKPIFVFQTIFNLVNKKILQVEKHFEESLNYAYLNEEGRKIYLKYWEEKITLKKEHPNLKRLVSNGSLIKYESYKLIKHLFGEKEFIPYNNYNSF